jgi:transcriptional regulator with XRE-family HTH domain
MTDMDQRTSTSGDGIAAETLVELGQRIRKLRHQRNLTLQQLGDATGLSPSMLSLVERGRTSPSIGSLVAVASALRVPLKALFDAGLPERQTYVARFDAQAVVSPMPGVSRRTAIADSVRHIEISVNEWQAGVATEPRPAHHPGFEYGLVLEGHLTVEVEGSRFVLGPGDLAWYESTSPHSLHNDSTEVVRAVWVNVGSF